MRSLGWAYAWIAATFVIVLGTALYADPVLVAFNGACCCVIGTTIGLILGRTPHAAHLAAQRPTPAPTEES